MLEIVMDFSVEGELSFPAESKAVTMTPEEVPSRKFGSVFSGKRGFDGKPEKIGEPYSVEGKVRL